MDSLGKVRPGTPINGGSCAPQPLALNFLGHVTVLLDVWNNHTVPCLNDVIQPDSSRVQGQVLELFRLKGRIAAEPKFPPELQESFENTLREIASCAIEGFFGLLPQVEFVVDEWNRRDLNRLTKAERASAEIRNLVTKTLQIKLRVMTDETVPIDLEVKFNSACQKIETLVDRGFFGLLEQR